MPNAYAVPLTEEQEILQIGKRTSKWPQYLAACLAALSSVGAGSLEAWTSPALPYLMANSTANPITEDEASWIGSLAPLGSLFGALPAGYLTNRYGRRAVLLGLSVPNLLGWIIIIAAQRTVILLYIARFLSGLSSGASIVVVVLYTEEIAQTEIRGELGSYLDIALSVGIVYVYAIGTFTTYMILCISSALVPFIFAITFFWMPESPMYLISKGKVLEAEKELRWLRNVKHLDSPDIKVELKDMENFIYQHSAYNDEMPVSTWERFMRFWYSICCNVALRRTLIIVIGLMVFQQLSGINAVIFYTVEIFETAGSTIPSYYSTLMIGIVQLLATYISALVMDRVGRRILLLISAIGIVLSLLAMTIFFVIKDNGVDVTGWNWVPLASLNIYSVAYCAGYGPIPWFMMVELADAKTKGWVSSLGVSVNWIMGFIVTKKFELLLHGMGQAATYGILCFFSFLGCIFVSVCVPETNGKTREEIQIILSGTVNKKHFHKVDNNENCDTEQISRL